MYIDIANGLFAKKWAFWFSTKTSKTDAVVLKLRPWHVKIVYFFLMQLRGRFTKRDHVREQGNQKRFDFLFLIFSLLNSLILHVKSFVERIDQWNKTRKMIQRIVNHFRIKIWIFRQYQCQLLTCDSRCILKKYTFNKMIKTMKIVIILFKKPPSISNYKIKMKWSMWFQLISLSIQLTNTKSNDRRMKYAVCDTVNWKNLFKCMIK